MTYAQDARGRWRRALLGALLAFVCATVSAVAWMSTESSDAAGPDVLAGAGDIGVCGSSASAATAAVLDGIDGTVMTLGDNAYPDGSDADYASCYDPTWGHLKARTRPVAGNHEYVTENGRPYYDYFGDAAGPRSKGWYSYDQAGWHIVVLNSNVDMSTNSEQLAWLRSDLAAHPTVCAAAMWHHPRFSSGDYAPGVASVADAWNTLYDAGVDVVLNGHEHFYERFAPMNRIGTPDPTGIRAFTVGTGGAPLRPPPTGTARWPTSELLRSDTHGVISLTLSPNGYDWDFRPVAGKTFTDHGTGTCTAGLRTNPDPTTTAPPVPDGPIAVDSFTRSVPVGLGSAEVGGAWQPQSGVSSFSVGGLRASIVIPAAGQFRAAYLPAAAPRDVSLLADFTTDKPGTGRGESAFLVARHAAPNMEYRARLRLAGSAVYLAITKLAGTSSELEIGAEVRVAGLVPTPGVPIRVQLDVTGTAPTQLKSRAWTSGSATPATWTVSTTDGTAGLQNPGSIGVLAYLSSSVTNAPVTFGVDDVAANPPFPSSPPTSTTTTSTTSTTTTTTSTTSSTTTTTTTLPPSTTAPPTTTTATTEAPTTTTTTTTAPPAITTYASDAFARTVPSSWTNADVGGPWQTTPPTGYAVSGTRGTIALAAGTTYTAALAPQFTDGNVWVTLNANKNPTGSGQYYYALVRRVSSNVQYAIRIRRVTTTSTTLSISRRTGGAETLLTPEVTIPNWSTGATLRVHGLVTGTNPTRLFARAWLSTATEPSTWTVTATDSSTALQRAGSAALEAYMSSASTNAPVTLNVDDFLATSP